MPSPNGYLTAFSYEVMDRNSFRVTVDHDTTSPPWLPGQAGSYTFIWETGPTAAGPWTDAPLTDYNDGCAPEPDNETGVGGVTDTVVRIGDPTPGTGMTADTDYFVRVTVLDPADAQVDQWVLDTAAHTEPYPTLVCLAPDPTQTSAHVVFGQSDGATNISPPCNQDTIVWEISTTPGGPYTAAPVEDAETSPQHDFTGLTPDTTYYYRARLSEQAESGGEYLVTPECSFTTDAIVIEPPVPPPFSPQPCAAGAGADAVDVEQFILCDLDAEGNLLGTALAVYEYDAEGTPTGAPTFVDPATGDPYVPQGTLQPCPDAACLPPIQFCQTSTTTGPVEHPGRQYDITLPINPGFAVQSLQVDAVNNPAGITWEVDDPDGETFRENLTTFIEGRVPAPAVVTITNPNAGVPQVCGAAQPMTVHIECLRLDQDPPDLIELVYNGGQDLIQNPAYNEFPALNPPVSQGNYGFHLLSREDDPGPFPGNPPSGDVLCTSVANRGWETNDVGRTFEIWGQDVSNGQNTTPTPRGTPVQEITSDGPPPGGRSTIWQTFVAPASGNFIIRVVHGARDPGEQHRITLDNGDTNDTQNGDLIDDISNPPSVTSSGGPNPWTQFNQTIPLNGGSTYTLALSTNNPAGGARGGLFTDMRAYIDRPDQRATATTDDETCVVTTEETQTNTLCSFWQPQCAGGAVVGWQKVDTGETMTNAEFWAQVPTPGCCLPDSGGEDGASSTLSNMLTSDIVCATVGGIQQNAIRVMVTDPSGGTLQVQFLGLDGAPIAPDTWIPGACTTSRFMADQILCDDNGPFLRKYVQSLDPTNQAQVNSFRDFTLAGVAYTPVGAVVSCVPETRDIELLELCDAQLGGLVVVPFVRVLTYDETGQVTSVEDQDADGNPYTPTGNVTLCSLLDRTTEILCDEGNGGQSFLRTYIASNGILAGVDDRELDGITPYAAVGPVGVCAEGCSTASSIGTVCYSPPVAVQTLQDDWTGATSVLGGGSRVWTNSNFANAGLTVTETVTPDTGATLFGGGVRNTATSPASQHTVIDLGAPRTNVTVRLDFFGNNQGERLRNITPAFDAVSGNGAAVLANTGVDGGPAGDGTIFLNFTGPVQTISWDYTPTGSGLSVQSFISFNTGNASNSAPAAVLRDCDTGETTYVDLATGTVLDPAVISIVDCPGDEASSAVDRVDAESQILCDSTPTRFLRTYTYGPTGAVTGFTDTTLAGAAFAPVGAVGVCAQTVQADTDFVEEVLCDSQGTPFIRLFRFNSVTGVLVSTTNTTLAGAAFVPVGAVGLCSDCCGTVIGEGCTNTGSGFYTAIRAANGTVTLVDSVSGAAVTAANIVACVDDDTVRTLTAEARILTNATPWTPGGDVTGTLTSLTVTGTSGLWDLVDANGTALTGLPAGLTLTWNAEDDNTLTGPQSVTPQAGATVVANWTQR